MIRLLTSLVIMFVLSGASGAIGVGIGAKVAKIGTLAGSKVIGKTVSVATDIAANTALGTIEDVVKDVAKNGKITEDIDVSSNLAAAVVGKSVGSVVEGLADKSKYLDNSAEMNNLEKTLKSAKQNAENNPKANPNSARNQKVNKAKEAIEKAKAKKAGNVTKAGIVAGAPSSSATKEYSKQQKSASTACFVAGTIVITDKGVKKIEDVIPGDKLMTRNEESGETELDYVADTVVSYSTKLLRITTSDGCTFLVTPPHSFFVTNMGWVPAKSLNVGDTLWSTLENSVVSEISVLDTESVVYNLVMAKNHNYFVSTCRTLVHNAEVEPPKQNTEQPQFITK